MSVRFASLFVGSLLVRIGVALGSLSSSAIALSQSTLSQSTLSLSTPQPTDRLLPTHNLAPLAERPDMPNELPGLVSRRIRIHLSRNTEIPVEYLATANTTTKTWTDDCLGLAKVDELCQQKEIEGWEVKVTDQLLNEWWYHTDRTGRRLRQKASPINKIIFQEKHNAILADQIVTNSLRADGTATLLITDRGGNLIYSSTKQNERAEVENFEQILAENNFAELDQTVHQEEGLADASGTFISAKASVVAHYSTTLSMPDNLRIVLEAWEKISPRY